MDCHQRLGQRAEALRVYRRCRDLLAAELGLAPSRATLEAARHASV
jgi:DNA-binding SARP family transcriptional activator